MSSRDCGRRARRPRRRSSSAAATPLGEPVPAERRRRRGPLLHVGHHRQAEGRRAHASRAARRIGPSAALFPSAAAPRRGRRRAAGRPHHGFTALLGLAARASRCTTCLAVPSRSTSSTPSSSGERRCSSACRRCTGCMARGRRRRRDLTSVRVWASGADVMPDDLAARFKQHGRDARRCRSSATSARRSSSRATAWSSWRGVAQGSPPLLSVGLANRSVRAARATASASSTTTADEVALGQVGELWVQGPGVAAAATTATRRRPLTRSPTTAGCAPATSPGGGSAAPSASRAARRT